MKIEEFFIFSFLLFFVKIFFRLKIFFIFVFYFKELKKDIKVNKILFKLKQRKQFFSFYRILFEKKNLISNFSNKI